jgi:hypothetical protein
MSHEGFLSEKYRLDAIRRVRQREICFFEDLSWTPSLLCELSVKLPVLPEVKISELYRRELTKTVVYKLHLPACSLVAKIYPIRQDLKQQSDEAFNYQIEIRFLKLFEELICKSVCPHYALAVGHCVMSAEQLGSLLPADFKDATHKYMFLLAEHAECTLLEILRKTHLSEYCLGALVLQVVLCLYITQDILSSFRHNDLHLNNVLVQKLKAENAWAKYRVHQMDYFIDHNQCPFRCLLWDFFYACSDTRSLPLVVPIKKEIAKDAPQTTHTRTKPNAYIDLHTFFDALHCVLHKKPISQGFRELLDFVVPERLIAVLKQKSRDEMQIWNEHLRTPLQVLEHEFFNRYRREPSPGFRLARTYVHPFVSA